MHTITLVRKMPQRPRLSLQEQAKFILDIVLRGKAFDKNLFCKEIKEDEEKKSDSWIFKINFSFEKKKGDFSEEEWDSLKEILSKAGQHTFFNKYPWELEDSNEVPGVRSILSSDKVLTIRDLKEKFPHTLLADESGKSIDEHPAFRGIFGRAAHIRICLSSIWSFIVSNGEKRTHTLLWGLPSSAKTSILRSIVSLFGEGCVLKLDATSTTSAGLMNLIFKKLPVVPPFIFMEEIEKANEDALRVWLGAMDDRAEFRKVTYREVKVREVKFLAMATANDKRLFDMMMGGRVEYPGALSSRFQQQLKCPRPTSEEMCLILERELPKINGKKEWILPCIELAKKINTDDPRAIIAFLDGRDRLLTNDYQRDILAVYRKD